MIRVSTKGRYALRAMIDLARHGGNGPVARSAIAERQGVSADYMAQLFQPLQKAGLVEGIKGPGGGYRLTRACADIRVRDVVEAVEGPVKLAPCVGGRQEPPCPREAGCATRRFWEELSSAIEDWLDSYTLYDVSRENQMLNQGPGTTGA